MKRILFFLIFVSTTIPYMFTQEREPISNNEEAKDNLVIDSVDKEPYFIIPVYSSSLNNKPVFSYNETNVNLNESTKRPFLESNLYRFVVPATFVTYGVLAHVFEPFQDFDWGAKIEVGEHIKDKFPYDDYLQYTPLVAVYGLDLAGVKAKHNIRDRTLILATSYLTMGIVVQGLKTTTGVNRPDNSAQNSFPSGHTATAFVGAHILMKEYKDVSPWIGVGGYTAAVATGIMRILNEKHWISDVAAGAGIGMLSAELGYILLPVWHNLFGIKDENKSLVVMPMYDTKSVGVGMSYSF